MAVKTIQIADKPTLDATKALLENGEYGLSAIRNAVDSGTGGSAGGLWTNKIVNTNPSGDISVSTLPYDFNYGAAVVYNNEIHILGSEYYNNDYLYAKYHYKFDGASWVRVSTLPYNFYNGSAVVLNNEIHIMGSSDGYTKHYKFNGSSWKSVSTLPYKFYGGAAVVYNNEIHILGSGNSSYCTKHYKFNGSSWESVSTLPYDFNYGAAVVYNNAIHILGSGNENQTMHYKFDGTSWTNSFTLPYNFYKGSAVVLDKNIHILGSGNSSYNKYHYIIKNNNHYIETILPKGAHILLSENEDIKYVKNGIRLQSNIAEITETGYVEILSELADPEGIKNHFIIY